MHHTTTAPLTEAETIARDYAYYTRTLAERQAQHDELQDWLGFPRENLAWAAAMDRAARRAMPKTDVMMREFRENHARKQYAAAIGVQL